jgi:hypothetical protein
MISPVGSSSGAGGGEHGLQLHREVKIELSGREALTAQVVGMGKERISLHAVKQGNKRSGMLTYWWHGG